MNNVRPTVHIESIAAGGAGVGHLPDGRAVFVQRTAPGDSALIEVVREKKRWASGRLLRVLEPGPGRRAAPCVHYARCGGCTLEHLEYGRQLEVKARIVRDALQRIGGLGGHGISRHSPVPADSDPHLPPVVAAPSEFRYRNRVSFTLVRTPAGRVIAGFHQLDRPDRIIDITADCLLLEPALAQAWHELRTHWGNQASLLPSGDQLRVTLRTTAQGAAVLVVEGGYSSGQPERLREAVPRLHSIWHRPAGSTDLRLLAGAAQTPENWQEEDVALSGTVFLQVNRAAAEALERHVLARALASGARTVVDAYCGIGLHARRLARTGCEVVGIEADGAAVTEARQAAPPSARFVQALVEEALADYLPADLVIVNPPRTGLQPRVVEALVAHRPARVLYVSCDPATLARDVGALRTSYTITDLCCFDLFPQTAHVESVLELTCVTS